MDYNGDNYLGRSTRKNIRGLRKQ